MNTGTVRRFLLVISSLIAGLICMDDFGCLGFVGVTVGTWVLLSSLSHFFKAILEGALISLGIILRDVIEPLLPIVIIILFIWIQYLYEWPK